MFPFAGIKESFVLELGIIQRNQQSSIWNRMPNDAGGRVRKTRYGEAVRG